MPSRRISDSQVVGVVGCSAGGLEDLRSRLVQPLVDLGIRVPVTLTPAAATWLEASGEVEALEKLTDLPVRWPPRLPTEERPHPTVDCFVIAPATANTVAKLALGVSDNQALTQLNEAMGVAPMVLFPRINAAHARHPAWDGHIAALRSVKTVRLVYGEDVWPLHEPRSEPDKQLPWAAILSMTRKALTGLHSAA